MKDLCAYFISFSFILDENKRTEVIEFSVTSSTNHHFLMGL